MAGLHHIRASTRDAIACGDYARALSVLRHALDQDPNSLSLQLDLAACLWRIYCHDEAISVFERLMGHPQINADHCLWMAKSFQSIGSFDDAVKPAAEAARREPDDPSVLTLYASVLERSGHLEKAEEVVRRAAELGPDNARPVRLLAHIERLTGRIDHARLRLERWLSDHGGGEAWRVRYELSTALDRMGHYDAAMAQALAAREDLAAKSAPLLEQSHLIRSKQWDVAQRISPEMLWRWRHDASTLSPHLRIALLAGFPRSGTTLVEQMIAAHPDCVNTDETAILLNEFVKPLVWSLRPERAAAELSAFDVDQIMAGREQYLKFTESYLGIHLNGRYLLEKEPLFTPDMPLLFRLFPDAKILMPLRDPRDVVVSYFFTMVPLNTSSAAATSLADSCRFYADSMRHWLRWREMDLPHEWKEVRYEQLIARPHQELQSITDFLQIDYRPEMAADQSRSALRAIHTPSYTDVAQPLYQRAVGRWQNYAEYFGDALKLLNPFVREFGYE